eukprot:TRINITY_DN5809_c0_g1_i1.p1 TRINITY_DN5809_c0_g1~~TRINITY_DN5809_c0_g1_i1.p1  ORF type:complete len:176 (+),score=13.24 TRINITY_DN5809_c0_g1_i1:100-627(+)
MFAIPNISLLLLLAVAVVYADTNSTECAHPVSGTCDFYPDCLEKAHPCGASGYAMGFGNVFCHKFSSLQHLTPAATTWRDSTRACLQDALVPLVHDLNAPGAQITCSQIETIAFNSHVACYTQPAHSICDLVRVREFADLMRIVKLILPELANGRADKQIFEVAAVCLRKWFSWI